MKKTIWFSLVAVLLGCVDSVEELGEGRGRDAGSDPTPDGPPDEPFERACPPIDPGALEPCCEQGAAHCAARGSYPGDFEQTLAACGADGVCVPDPILEAGDGFAFTPCSSGLGEGACVSLCLPDVQANAAFLEQSTCAVDERCAPCADPLSGEDLGICGWTLACEAADPDPDPVTDPEPAYDCENPPDGPVVDVAGLDPCCAGAHCVPRELGGDDDATAMLASCDDGAGFCVPDVFIQSAGVFTLASCTSIAGIEGRCMSTCLPDVAAQEGSLPVDVCAPTERCVPCCDPTTGEETGACSLSCDTGPAGACGAPAFPTCCDDDSGHCIPAELVPDDAEEGLSECGGQAGGGEWGEGGGGGDGGERAFCVPDVLQDPAWQASACTGQDLLGEYDGVCMPSCLNIPMAFMLDAGSCPERHLCVPCTDPLTGEPTGAPGCAQDGA